MHEVGAGKPELSVVVTGDGDKSWNSYVDKAGRVESIGTKNCGRLRCLLGDDLWFVHD